MDQTTDSLDTLIAMLAIFTLNSVLERTLLYQSVSLSRAQRSLTLYNLSRDPRFKSAVQSEDTLSIRRLTRQHLNYALLKQEGPSI